MADEKTKIILELDLDDGSVRRVGNEAEKGTKKAGKKAGKSFSKSFNKETNQGFKLLTKGAIAAAAAIGAALAGKEIIQAAVRQQSAINGLNASLRAIGEFSQATSKDLQDFASQLQSVTTFGDEAVLEQLAFAQALGASAEQSKEVVAAAADLAAGLNIDLNSATRNVAKTLGGFAGELGEVIPELKNLTREQLQAGAGVEILANKFRGLAAARTQTFGGAFQQTINLLGDFFEEIGNLVIKVPEVVAVFIAFGQVIGNVTGLLKENSEDIRSFISDGINLFIVAVRIAANVFNGLGQQIQQSAIFKLLLFGFNQVATLIRENFVPTLNFLFNVFSGLRNGFLTLVNFILSSGGKLVKGLASVIGALDPDSELAAKVNAALVELDNNVLEFADKTQDNFSRAFDTEALNNGNDFVEAFNQFIADATAGAIDEETGESVFSKVLEPFNEENLSAIVDRVKGFGKEVAKGLKEGGKQAEDTGKKAEFALKNRFGAGIAGGIQNITQSLLNGENAFSNFGKFLFSLFGDLAIQLGTFFITQGLAVEALNAISGTGAIAAGAALVALGTLLKSFSGGASSPIAGANAGGQGVGGGVAGAGIGGDESAITDPEERAEPETRIAVNIQGDVLDSRDSGLRIVELISDAFDREAAIVTGARGF
jgi:hypothetical protein